MEIFSPYIIAGLLGWVAAHTLKYTIAAFKARSWRQFHRFRMSGGMPSAHSATIVAVTLTIGLIDGFGTPVFALAAALTSIVMYDAITVRRSSGEQGTALLEYLTQIKSKIIPPRVALGHSPLEVAVGSLLGVIISLAVVAWSSSFLA